jgi:hypothetical protein
MTIFILLLFLSLEMATYNCLWDIINPREFECLPCFIYCHWKCLYYWEVFPYNANGSHASCGVKSVLGKVTVSRINMPVNISPFEKYSCISFNSDFIFFYLPFSGFKLLNFHLPHILHYTVWKLQHSYLPIRPTSYSLSLSQRFSRFLFFFLMVIIY